MGNIFKTMWLETQNIVSCQGKLRQGEIGLAIREAQDYAHGHELRVVGGAISVVYKKQIENGAIWCDMEVMLPVRQ